MDKGTQTLTLSKVEAEKVARFVAENHNRINDGVLIDRLTNGTLRVRRMGLLAARKLALKQEQS